MVDIFTQAKQFIVTTTSNKMAISKLSYYLWWNA